MRHTIMFFSALCALSIFALAGCGGGGGPAPVGTTVNRGIVTAEGNILVNGTFYNISSASIIIDGQGGTKRDLKVGMVVTVKGIFDNRTSHAIRRVATRVEYASNFQGPVDCVNPLNNSLTIMGQQVLIKSDNVPFRTMFANFTSNQVIFASISSASKLNPHLSPRLLNPGLPADPDPASPTYNPYLFSFVRVSGFDNGINGFVATRIQLVTGQDGVDLLNDYPVGIRGTVTGVDVPGMTFAIGNLTVDYSGMIPAYRPTSLAPGLFVDVRGVSSELSPGNAPSLTFVSPHLVNRILQGVPANEGAHMTIVGYVSRLAGTLFTIDGTPIDASILSLSGISNALLVQVEGIFTNGVLVATKITLL